VVGTSALYARQDHDHGLPSLPSTSSTWAHCWRAAAQAFLTGGNTWVIQTYDNTETGSSSALNASTGVYTVPVNGDYFFAGETNFPANPSGGSVFIALFKNGAVHSRGAGMSTAPVNTQVPSLHVASIIRCNAGDTVAVRIWCSIAGGISSAAGGADTNYFTARWLL
jgi:hypothetical protein